MQLLFQKYLKMFGYCDKSVIVILLPIPKCVKISYFHCTDLSS